MGRGADDDIRRYVEKRLKDADERRRAELEAMLERLGWTPLHAAAEVDEPGRIVELLAKGADINARAANGQTPLHVAASHGSYGSIDALLKHKADPDVKNKHGRTAIQLGMRYDDAVEQLLAGGAEIPDILVAAFAGRADLVKSFIEKDKASVRAKAEDGNTPLHLAARLGHFQVVEVLLANGAEVDARARSKFTPLHWAAIYGRHKVVALLLKHKADRNAKSWDGKIPLDYARESYHDNIIRLLQKDP